MPGWFGRVLLLVLSGMASLAIIGAIAAVPSRGLPDLLSGRADSSTSIPMPAPASDAAPSGEEPLPGDGGRSAPPGAVAAGSAGAAAEPTRPAESEWLEPLTYAVMSLAGFAAAGLIALLRISAQLGVIARGERPFY